MNWLLLLVAHSFPVVFSCSESLAGVNPSCSDYATGCTTEESLFDSRQGQEFSFLQNVKTGFGAHAATCAVGACV